MVGAGAAVLAHPPLWELFLQGNRRRFRTTRAADLAAALHTLPAADGVRVWHDHEQQR